MIQELHWIKAVTTLSVAHFQSGFHPKPEIGKLVSETAFSGYTGLIHIACTDNYCLRMAFQLDEEFSEVFSEVLPIGIDGDGIIVSRLDGMAKSRSQSVTFAFVF